MTYFVTGMALFVHIRMEHWHPAKTMYVKIGSAFCNAADGDDHDEDHCPVCAALRAPLINCDVIVVQHAMTRVVDRIITFEAQCHPARLSVPRDSRGPPLF